MALALVGLALAPAVLVLARLDLERPFLAAFAAALAIDVALDNLRAPAAPPAWHGAARSLSELALRVAIPLALAWLRPYLLETEPISGLPGDLPMTVEAETGFHFRRRGDRLVLAMNDPAPRWGFDEVVDESVFDDRLARLAHRYPPAAETTIADAWAGLYDMTPDAHPIIGWVGDGVYAACGFSGHGFMQSPGVGKAAAAELLEDDAPFDLEPYRLERFAAGAVFPETVVL